MIIRQGPITQLFISKLTSVLMSLTILIDKNYGWVSVNIFSLGDIFINFCEFYGLNVALHLLPNRVNFGTSGRPRNIVERNLPIRI